MTFDANDFFDEAKDVSLAKIRILGGYLDAWSKKLGSLADRLWVIDGFAGQGAYQPDEHGRIEDGSPRAAAKLAQQIAHKADVRQAGPRLHCINIEADPTNYQQLMVNLAPYRDHCTNLPGEFTDHLDDVLRRIRRDPAFFFLDPFGVVGIEMDVVEQIIRRDAISTEVLIHLSDRSLRRMAGHVIVRDRTVVGHRAGQSKLGRLDAVIGTPLWRRIWAQEHKSTDERAAAIVELYLSQLKERASGGRRFHAHDVPMRDSFLARPRYRLVFGTRSLDGVEQMSDRAYVYEDELHRKTYEGSFEIDWRPQRHAEQCAQLRDELHREGCAAGTISRRDLVRIVLPRHFGEFKNSDYDRCLRDLVEARGIDRASSSAIKPTEPLRFVELQQMRLGD